MPGLWSRTRTTLEMIKWEHSIFALPFALTAMLLAARGLPPARTVVWILIAMIAARSAAMAFNRWADAKLDAANPRTRTRAIPAGLLTRRFVLGFTVLAVVIFELAAAELNRLTLILSPVVLLVLLGYSYLKRFTRWSHLGLGLALGLAPSAAWIAVRGSLDPRILILTAAVTLWAGGFDVLYACQDCEHDRAASLHSLPQANGIPAAFFAARAMHLAMIVLLVWFWRDRHRFSCLCRRRFVAAELSRPEIRRSATFKGTSGQASSIASSRERTIRRNLMGYARRNQEAAPGRSR